MFNVGDEVIFNNEPDMIQSDYLCTFGKPYTILHKGKDTNGKYWVVYVDVGQRKPVAISESLFTLHKRYSPKVSNVNISQLFEEKVKNLHNGSSA